MKDVKVERCEKFVKSVYEKIPIPMLKKGREYFKNGVKTLCGIEMLVVARFIEQKKSRFTKSDYEFMKQELGRQAGAIWAKLLRALKKADFKEAQKILTGGNGK